MKKTMIVCAALALAGCAMQNPFPRLERDPERVPTDVVVHEAAVVRDETLVPAPEPGSIAVVEEPLRAVEGVSGGRAWLLELHRETLAQKDELERRCAAQAVELAESERARTALAAERDRLASATAELEARVRTLEAQALDLARRLVDAELARLEAEKEALEQEARAERKERP